MPRQMHVSLFLLLLLFLFVQLCGTSGALAEQSAGVVREVPRKGQGASQAYTVVTTHRKFIRINASYEDLTRGKYCSKSGESIEDFEGKSVQCTSMYFLSDDMIARIKDTIIPAAIKLHADRLLVDPVSGPLKVPEFKEENVCKNFTVPSEHRDKGLENADMVLYVAARPQGPFGLPCAYDNSGRPVAGAINIIAFPLKLQRYNVRLVAHEIAHALGFDYQLFVKNNMVSEITGGNGEGKRVLVNSERTKQMARQYFGCDKLDGLELGYAAPHLSGELSHWAWRNTNDDLMTSAYQFGAMHYSALTMSVFDDLKFYTANWGMEESMTWGNNSGCELFESKCTAETVTKYPGRFCRNDVSEFSCSSDRLGLGACEGTPDDREPNAKVGECMITEVKFFVESEGVHSLFCSETPTTNFSASIYASDSLCLDTEPYETMVETEGYKMPVSVTALCARVSCDEGKVKVIHSGISEWQECPENTSIEVKRTDLDPITLKCPKYIEVCTIAPDGSSRVPLIVPPYDEPTKSPGSGGDGCVAPALLAPVLLLVMALALLLHL